MMSTGAGARANAPERAHTDAPERAHNRAHTRTTRQRAAVLDQLQSAAGPVSAQDLHAAMGRSVGLATVYRTLQGLVDAGQVDVFRRDTGESLFRLCNPVHHHHLMCEGCGRVEEIDACEVEPWAAEVAARRGFTISRHQADIIGRCPDCQGAPAGS